ncbi:unnamed protein product [Rhizoctonia solani]|uniref:Protein kinase domain-containing protein n=1 Tax=Rhizoctonia solani TaxID=456999 RepID=A0A8H2WQ42_9AGAM|nr:unnamed protein product [Rhizoctonia solani]
MSRPKSSRNYEHASEVSFLAYSDSPSSRDVVEYADPSNAGGPSNRESTSLSQRLSAIIHSSPLFIKSNLAAIAGHAHEARQDGPFTTSSRGSVESPSGGGGAPRSNHVPGRSTGIACPRPVGTPSNPNGESMRIRHPKYATFDGTSTTPGRASRPSRRKSDPSRRRSVSQPPRFAKLGSISPPQVELTPVLGDITLVTGRNKLQSRVKELMPDNVSISSFNSLSTVRSVSTLDDFENNSPIDQVSTSIRSRPQSSREREASIRARSRMFASKIVSHLVAYGCKDITSDLLLSTFGKLPVSRGTFADVYRGELLDGTYVAVKALRVSAESLAADTSHIRDAAEELYTWSKCQHPNVLPLLGLAMFRGRIGMVSPWMWNGNLPRYLEREKEANRHQLCLQICEGVSYLHRIGVVHGGLRGAEVLVSDEGTPVLADFGGSILRDQALKFTQPKTNLLRARWSAPELLNGTCSLTESSDIYALGMQVAIGRLPYEELGPNAIWDSVVMKKESPPRPETLPKGHEHNDKLWELLVRCWSFEPAARPSATEIVEILRATPFDVPLGIKAAETGAAPHLIPSEGAISITSLDSEEGQDNVLIDDNDDADFYDSKHNGSDVRLLNMPTAGAGGARVLRGDGSSKAPEQVENQIHDSLCSPEELEYNPISRQMTVLEVISHLANHGCKDVSQDLELDTFDEHPISNGGCSDIYRGTMSNGTLVAMKSLRISMNSFIQDSKHLKHAARELHIWSKCNHPNVIPLFGLAAFRNRIGMVSPWMGQGNLPHYLKISPDADRGRLCVQISDGLAYLHQIGIIHADLKGANVLISDKGNPVLTDFGNSLLMDQTMKFTQTTSAPRMTVRWTAAEVIEGTTEPSKPSDVYALGMTIYVSHEEVARVQ